MLLVARDVHRPRTAAARPRRAPRCSSPSSHRRPAARTNGSFGRATGTAPRRAAVRDHARGLDRARSAARGSAASPRVGATTTPRRARARATPPRGSGPRRRRGCLAVHRLPPREHAGVRRPPATGARQRQRPVRVAVEVHEVGLQPRSSSSSQSPAASTSSHGSSIHSSLKVLSNNSRPGMRRASARCAARRAAAPIVASATSRRARRAPRASSSA